MKQRIPTFALIGLLGTVALTAGLQGCTEKGEQAPLPGSRVALPDRPDPSLPNVVPHLDTIPSAVDGQGTAVLKPAEPVPAGWNRTFEITFTVGEAGIVPGGFVMLQVSPWWGWSEPQTRSPNLPGYTKVTTSFSDPSLRVATLPLSRVLVFSRERAVAPGEAITFRYSNAQVDRFAEAEELFQVFVDADGDGHSACIADPPTLRVLPRAAVRLSVNAPSQVQPAEAIAISAAPLDALGNWSQLPAGSYTLKPTRDGQPLGDATLEAATGDTLLTFAYTPAEEGIYFFGITGPAGLRGKSNVTLCREGTPSLNLYFGDIHGHSRMSDGTGTPEDYYRYARRVSGLDIAALTDHSDFGTIPFKSPVWDRIKRAAQDAYEPGRFVTFVAFEWTNWQYGHRNVYYRDGKGPVFRSIDPESDTPQKLWRLIEPFEAMTVAHHVGGGPVATDWNIPPGTQERLVEICSIHGSSEHYGGEACIYHAVKGAFVRDALAQGYRLGIIGSGDTHDGHPGQCTVGAIVGGLLGAYSPQLTREAVWQAFQRRQVYATSGPKIILNFRVADSPMGGEVAWSPSSGPIPVGLRVVCCDAIEAVEIIRSGETLFHEKGNGVFAQLLIQDPQPLPGVSWYYARILQKDGNMAWSSPVWVTME